MFQTAESLLGRLHSGGVEVELSFGNCSMLSLEALIQSKEAMGRQSDLAAVRQLRAIKDRNGFDGVRDLRIVAQRRTMPKPRILIPNDRFQDSISG